MGKPAEAGRGNGLREYMANSVSVKVVASPSQGCEIHIRGVYEVASPVEACELIRAAIARACLTISAASIGVAAVLNATSLRAIDVASGLALKRANAWRPWI